MEENVYNRQVTKLAVSKRVIDELQVDRHYTEGDLTSLYRMEIEREVPVNFNCLSKDELLSSISMDHIYKYHEHDLLLENNSTEKLTERERNAAWIDYRLEREENKVPRRKPRRQNQANRFKRKF